MPRPARAWPAPAPLRRLRLSNAHTGESFDGPFRDDVGPISQAMSDLSVFLRDHHSGEKIAIDVGVLDFLASVMDAVGATSATILSAYRTRETNAMLARTTFGVADNSQHIYGRALDPSGTVVGPRKVLLVSQPGGWEGGVVEGPTVVSFGTTTYLLYSGGYYLGSGYGEGEAVRHGNPLGRFRRTGRGPVLLGDRHWVGTGGGSIVEVNGEPFLAYNAFAAKERPVQRRLFMRPLGLVQEGRSRTWLDDQAWWLGIVEFQPPRAGRAAAT